MTHPREPADCPRDIEIIGVCCGLGGQDPGAADGPQALRAAGLADRLGTLRYAAQWIDQLTPAPGHLPDIFAVIGQLARRTAKRVVRTIAAGQRPLVLGGDHSCAVGTWSGVHAAIHARGPMGLIWVDAHLDSHTPESSHTGLVYGMPLAALLGHGTAELTHCASPMPKLRPEHVCVVGARSYEPGERALLDRLGVRVIGMNEVARRGTASALAEAAAIAGRAPAGFGISIDLDAIDPRDAPAVGTPAPGGMRGTELVAALQSIAAAVPLTALEIAEYNPHRDRAGLTRELVAQLAAAALGTCISAGRSAIAA